MEFFHALLGRAVGIIFSNTVLPPQKSNARIVAVVLLKSFYHVHGSRGYSPNFRVGCAAGIPKA